MPINPLFESRSRNGTVLAVAVILLVATTGLTGWIAYQQGIIAAYAHGQASIGTTGYADGYASGSDNGTTNGYTLAYPNGYTTGYYAGSVAGSTMHDVTVSAIHPTIDGQLTRAEWISADYYNVPKYWNVDAYPSMTDGLNYLSVGRDSGYLYIGVDLPSVTSPVVEGYDWVAVGLNALESRFHNAASFDGAINAGSEVVCYDIKSDDVATNETLFSPLGLTHSADVILHPYAIAPTDTPSFAAIPNQRYGNYSADWADGIVAPNDHAAVAVQCAKSDEPNKYGVSLQLTIETDRLGISPDAWQDIRLQYRVGSCYYDGATNNITDTMYSVMADVRNSTGSAVALVMKGLDDSTVSELNMSDLCVMHDSVIDLNFTFWSTMFWAGNTPADHYIIFDYLAFVLPQFETSDEGFYRRNSLGDVDVAVGFGVSPLSSVPHRMIEIAIPIYEINLFTIDHSLRIFVQCSHPTAAPLNIDALHSGCWFGSETGSIVEWNAYWAFQLGLTATVVR